MTADLLRLLEAAHPNASPEQLRLMLSDIPDRNIPKAPQKPAGSRSGSRPRTDASMERRRSWAASGRMPPRLAARFTLAEQAVLAVVAEQVAKFESSTLPLDHIAALAGVCRTTVRNALAQAKAFGFIRVQERRLSAWRNLPHLITITSPEWLTWLKMRGRKGELSSPFRGGRKSVRSTNTDRKKEGYRKAEERLSSYDRSSVDSHNPLYGTRIRPPG